MREEKVNYLFVCNSNTKTNQLYIHTSHTNRGI